MKVSNTVAERGHKYYMENRVRYISIDGTHGYAIVEGSKAYEVEFQYNNGEISGLTCSCFCSGSCKHQFATMLQLRETLEIIDYSPEIDRNLKIISFPTFPKYCGCILFDCQAIHTVQSNTLSEDSTSS